MLKALSLSALASAAVLAGVASVSAAGLSANLSVGHIAPPRMNVGAANIAASNQSFTPDHIEHQGPKQKKWVCGPIVNWDGTPHCHWVEH